MHVLAGSLSRTEQVLYVADFIIVIIIIVLILPFIFLNMLLSLPATLLWLAHATASKRKRLCATTWSHRHREALHSAAAKRLISHIIHHPRHHVIKRTASPPTSALSSKSL
jgi:hypothetical protein